MSEEAVEVALADEAATAWLGEDLALALKPGDLVRLEGDLGAGKTTLARAVIRAMAGEPDLGVPSPTFTLVQSYDLRLSIHHLDLYRLGSPDELDELGLDELVSDGVALVEWPQRGGDRLPPAAVTIRLEHEGAGRRAFVSGSAPALSRLRRSLLIRDFLKRSGVGHTHRQFLLGDASTRAYEIVSGSDGGLRILMNAPRQPDGPPIRDGKPYSQIAHLAENVLPFVAVGEALRREGFHAPAIEAADLDQGLLLIEHLGSGSFLGEDGEPVEARYEEAARLLARLHQRRWPSLLPSGYGPDHQVPDYDRGAMMIEVELLLEWYLPFIAGRAAGPETRAAFVSAWNAVLDRLVGAETSLVLRDYHSPNLIWRPDRPGFDRIGLIDFQDAMIGPGAYDVASLAMDARVTIPEPLERATVEAYAAARHDPSFNREMFDMAYAIMAAQRNSKILGIFVRLDRRDGKPQYLKHLPRIRAYLGRALRHPALAPVASLYRTLGVVEEAEA
jgi:tRNA threonylcarbamoyl adenosine modification protein YjeE